MKTKFLNIFYNYFFKHNENCSKPSHLINCHLHHLRNFNNHPNILKPSQLSKHSNKLLHVNLDLPGISEHLQENILENLVEFLPTSSNNSKSTNGRRSLPPSIGVFSEAGLFAGTFENDLNFNYNNLH